MSLADQIVESRKAFLKVLDELTLDALALQSMTPDGKRLMLTASAQKPGHYQLTRFDDQGAPWGDTNYPTKMAELVELDRKRVVKGKGVSERVDLVGRRYITKKKLDKNNK